MSGTRPPSTIKDPTHHHSAKPMLKQPLTNKSDDDIHVSLPDSATALLSPSLSLSSSSTLHYKASALTEHHSRNSSTTTTNSRHFYSSALGRPPGSQKRKTTPTPTPSSSFPMTNSPNKTIPMKELQKIIADLKKENFDLKLRLYHLEKQTEDDMDKYWLEEENHRLQLELDDRTMQVEKLELTVSTLLSQQQQQSKSSCDASTQASIPPTPNMSNQASTIDTSSESRFNVVQASPYSAPVLPTFPADPASFGLPPSSALSASAVTSSSKAPTLSSSSTNNNNYVDVASIVDRFQNVRLASPKTNRRHSSATTTSRLKPLPEDHRRVAGWLDGIPTPFTSPSRSPPSCT